MVTNKSLLLFCILIVGVTGCVERKLTINTNPAGAQVFLNDEEIGVSPVTTSFNWYGDYNITIRKQGCETLQTHRKLQAPLHDLFPFDFVTQILYPGRIVDSYEWSFDLKPQKDVGRQELIQAAEQLSKQDN
ncbi:MAG: PEGA domain-containing protein [Sedimentisphaerales bacterium]|jgi:hypothetical protein